jgi:hypothetical protein
MSASGAMEHGLALCPAVEEVAGGMLFPSLLEGVVIGLMGEHRVHVLLLLAASSSRTSE